MARRLLVVTALFVAGLVATSCSGKGAAPKAEPVHVPEITQNQTVQSPMPAPAPNAPAPAPPPKSGKPSYPDPAPAISYPSGPPAVAKPAEFMPWVEQTGWSLKAVQGLFPAAEGTYKNGSGEEPNWSSYAYDGGALRLFAGGDGLFAVLVDTRRPGYQAFRDVKSGPGYQVERRGDFTVMLKVADSGTQKKADALRGSKGLNLTALEPQIGKPTFSYHHHGVGSFSYVCVPAGISFSGYAETDVEAGTKSAAEVRQQVAASLMSEVAAFAQGQVKGRLSPGGKWWAAKLELGGYWNNWIVVRAPGQAEQRYQSDYFITDFHWLDDHRIVYTGSPTSNFTFRVIDIWAKTQKAALTVSARLSEFGVAGPGKVWYKTDKGTRFEVDIP